MSRFHSATCHIRFDFREMEKAMEFSQNYSSVLDFDMSNDYVMFTNLTGEDRKNVFADVITGMNKSVYSQSDMDIISQWNKVSVSAHSIYFLV